MGLGNLLRGAPFSRTMDADLSTNRTHPALCFYDATVAIFAGGCHFLVHAGLLARHSPVLAETFKDTAPPNHFRGQPVFEVKDSAQDMAFFLLALYDGTYVPRLQSCVNKN